MKFSILPMIASAMAVSISYDPIYAADLSMGSVACSNGDHGLMEQYPTLGQVPGFPNVGGIPDIAGWNSPSCGTCWKVTIPNGNSIFIRGVDSGRGGFNVNPTAFTKLVGSTEAGRVDNVNYEQVDLSFCINNAN
uniref:CF-FAG protein n=2 Tax=Ceratocystis TaxID=5157 RepID=A4KTR1_9PEZI|nr:CF-MANG protein [Ceratocystis fimbriata]QNN25949.1 cerato-platanin protein [Ceratocystis manginecans]ABM63512.1 CF-FAG protein [Ceratocystis fimbriata]QBO55778.1 cerato-platanin [Ceratocystis fimbriata]QBO55779.1 cerato-platanin [Ceratocystis fimbriata]